MSVSTTTFEIYRDIAGEWRYRLKHENGNILIDSAEGYTNEADCRKAIRNLKNYVRRSPVKGAGE